MWKNFKNDIDKQAVENEFHLIIKSFDQMIEEKKGSEALNILNQYVTKKYASKDLDDNKVKVIKLKIKIAEALLQSNVQSKSPTFNQ